MEQALKDRLEARAYWHIDFTKNHSNHKDANLLFAAAGEIARLQAEVEQWHRNWDANVAERWERHLGIQRGAAREMQGCYNSLDARRKVVGVGASHIDRASQPLASSPGSTHLPVYFYQGDAIVSAPPVHLSSEQIRLLGHWLDALDEWGCEDNEERAKEIASFMLGGFDLSDYEEGRPNLRVIDGGKSPPGGDHG